MSAAIEFQLGAQSLSVTEVVLVQSRLMSCLDYDLLAGSLAVFLCVFLVTAMAYRPGVTRREIRLRLGASNVVRFPDEDAHSTKSLHQYIPNHDKLSCCWEMDEKAKRQLWWRQKDFRKFKETTAMLGKELQIADNGHQTPSSYTDTVKRVFQACCLAKSENADDVVGIREREQLDRWMGVGTLRIGLEQLVVRSMSNGCNALRHQLVDDVLETQRMNPGDAEAIREASIKRSRPTRLFATIIAQAIAVSHAQDTDDEEEDSQQTNFKLD